MKTLAHTDNKVWYLKEYEKIPCNYRKDYNQYGLTKVYYLENNKGDKHVTFLFFNKDNQILAKNQKGKVANYSIEWALNCIFNKLN